MLFSCKSELVYLVSSHAGDKHEKCMKNDAGDQKCWTYMTGPSNHSPLWWQETIMHVSPSVFLQGKSL